MESRDERYEPGEDENQGPLSALARNEQVDPEIGEPQIPRMSPNHMQGNEDSPEDPKLEDATGAGS